MAQIQPFDPVGAFQRGRSNALSIQAQEQGLAQAAAEAPARNQLLDMKLQGAQSQQQREQTGFAESDEIKRSKVMSKVANAMLTADESQWPGMIEQLNPKLETFGLPPLVLENLSKDKFKQVVDVSQSFIDDPSKLLKQAQLEGVQAGTALTKEKTATSLAERTPKPVEPGTVTPEVQALTTATSNVSEEIGKQAIAAYNLAGGGKEGQKALAKVLEKGPEQERRANSPQLIAQSFPKASEAETIQLQAAMDAGKTTEAGLKEATKVRSEQRRLQKAKGFQERAIELLDNILASGEGFLGGDLGDVLGSIEGRIDTKLFSDDEAQVISDIEEAGNILTSDNLDLMSGVLSETDIKILQNLAGGALVRTRNKDRFVKDVTTLRDKLSSKLVETIDDKIAKLPEGTVNNGDGTFTLPNGNVVRAKNG